MPQYFNIFTRVQVRAPAYDGVPLPKGRLPRIGKGVFPSYWLGKIGDTQIGPIYLGFWGLLSLMSGFLAFLMVGIGMLASVSWNPIHFFKFFPWLALEPPPPHYGLHIPPLWDGGMWLIAGFFFTLAFLAWWIRVYVRARDLGMGTHVAWGFAAAIWFFLNLGFFRPVLMGSWSEGVPMGWFPHLDWLTGLSLAYGNFYYNPFHMLGIGFMYGSALLWAMHGGTILAVSRFGGDREIDQIVDRGTAAERAALFWRWTMGWNASMESIHRWGFWFATCMMICGGFAIGLTGTYVDNWHRWAEKHHFAPVYPTTGVTDPAAAEAGDDGNWRVYPYLPADAAATEGVEQ
ncbi:photosynthetic reaction center M subunit [Thioflavicoccus mobilis 8321]|uniref:Reaction center protein M chain n=2 Tax=Thioflavicoccus mobilis TaxID=80679 RepID=U3GLF0_9GAMM|nr:photosynthetic reaction center subunit M [Thioflavicoccus mobilis]AGA91688.1 photosynthetic reaction center M subunit [Thioflavicoccus mobilis 8321]